MSKKKNKKVKPQTKKKEINLSNNFIPEFIPISTDEIKKLGWSSCDVIFITGDTYIDSYTNGVALLGKLLLHFGFKVAMIPQPDVHDSESIALFGEPTLFWGVTAGALDSMVANYTASGKKRKSDDFTPGGQNSHRPDLATNVHTALIRRKFPKTTPIVIGGIEAGLRRFSHYDFIENAILPSILHTSGADLLCYGMGERTVLSLAQTLRSKENVEEKIHQTRGIVYKTNTPPSKGFISLPSHQETTEDQLAFEKMHQTIYDHADPIHSKGLFQKFNDFFLVQNPPQPYLTTTELDMVHSLPFTRKVHPICKAKGTVKALETIQFSITTHRGCYGQCSFCSIGVHQGHTIRSRSIESILAEAESFIKHPDFKGIISDIGGPTANMYGIDCSKKKEKGDCKNKNCLTPETCDKLPVSHKKQLTLLSKLRSLPNIRHIFIASGIRYDLILSDKKFGETYLETILKHHVSGQMKIAPEHVDDKVLQLMRKPPFHKFMQFLKLFRQINNRLRKKNFLTTYLIAAHPGCGEKEAQEVPKIFKKNGLPLPEQIQIFTPTPLTWSTVMFITGRIPGVGKKIHVVRNKNMMAKQKNIMQNKS